VDPLPDPLLLSKSDSAGNRTRTSGSVARNSNQLDHNCGPRIEILGLFVLNLSLCLLVITRPIHT
jgi:hypothetical protein